jgi:hypothetical protein
MISQRNPATPRVLSLRSAIPADLEALRAPSARARLKSLRDSHHNIARLLAQGLTLAEISQATGYTVSRISVLSRDPSMQDQVARYRDLVTDSWQGSTDTYYETIQRIGKLARAQLLNQLVAAEESGEDLPFKNMLAAAADADDRVGYMKKSTQFNVNVGFAKDLEAAISRSRAARPKLIEGETTNEKPAA